MYFIHDKYNPESVKMLETLPEGTEVIDYFTSKDSGDTTYWNLNTVGMPCLVEELEFLDFPLPSEPETEPEPPPEITNGDILQKLQEEETENLIRDELLLEQQLLLLNIDLNTSV